MHPCIINWAYAAHQNFHVPADSFTAVLELHVCIRLVLPYAELNAVVNVLLQQSRMQCMVLVDG